MSPENRTENALSLAQMRAILRNHHTALHATFMSFPDERMLQRIFESAASQLPSELYAACKQHYQAQLGELKRLRHEYACLISEARSISIFSNPTVFWEVIDRYASLRGSLFDCLCRFNQLLDDTEHHYDELSIRRREKRLDALSQKVSMMHGLLAKQPPARTASEIGFRDLDRRVHQLSASLLRHQKAIDEERRLQAPHRGIAQLDSCDTIDRLEEQAALVYTELCDYTGLNRHIST